MLIDWITCHIDLEHLDPDSREKALHLGDRLCRYCPKTGEIVYETFAWDSIRSDSHQISIKASGQGVSLMGSPARCMGDGCAVFGSGASSALDISGCIARIVQFVQSATGIVLPTDHDLWRVTRLDVTANLAMACLPEVRDALRVLRDCEGGRYRVSAQAGDTVYWSNTSKLRKGKAYAKGPHLAHLMKKKGYTGRQYTTEEIDKANRILRLELTIGREYFARHDWKKCTPLKLQYEWQTYFYRMIGSAEMKSDDDVKSRIYAVAPTENQARAAYCCWTVIKEQGWERAKEMFSKSVWYRHLKLLRDAGLGDADISTGNVVQFRRKIFTAQQVDTWKELHAAS